MKPRVGVDDAGRPRELARMSVLGDGAEVLKEAADPHCGCAVQARGRAAVNLGEVASESSY